MYHSQTKPASAKQNLILAKQSIEEAEDLENENNANKAVKFTNKKTKSRTKSDVHDIDEDQLAKEFREFSFSKKKVNPNKHKNIFQSTEDDE